MYECGSLMVFSLIVPGFEYLKLKKIQIKNKSKPQLFPTLYFQFLKLSNFIATIHYADLTSMFSV